MKLLLTSGGLTNDKIKKAFTFLLGGTEGKRCLMIHTTRSQEDYKWLDYYDKELKEIKLDYDLVNISKEKNCSELTDYDVYYVLGGNTFYILDRLRKTNMDEVILGAINQGKVYAGVSAGSIIMSKDIEIAGIGDMGDENDIDLKDLAGFGLVSFHISPHFNEQEKPLVEEFYNKREEPVVALTDEQAILIHDKIQTVGEGEVFTLPNDYNFLDSL